MSSIRNAFYLIAVCLAVAWQPGCQSMPPAQATMVLDVRVLDTVKWEMSLLQGAGSYCRTTVPVEVVAPERFSGRKLSLVLQSGLSGERDDWIAEGTMWRPIGARVAVYTTESAIADDEVYVDRKFGKLKAGK